jgi:hypothetical protein
VETRNLWDMPAITLSLRAMCFGYSTAGCVKSIKNLRLLHLRFFFGTGCWSLTNLGSLRRRSSSYGGSGIFGTPYRFCPDFSRMKALCLSYWTNGAYATKYIIFIQLSIPYSSNQTTTLTVAFFPRQVLTLR